MVALHARFHSDPCAKNRQHSERNAQAVIALLPSEAADDPRHAETLLSGYLGQLSRSN